MLDASSFPAIAIDSPLSSSLLSEPLTTTTTLYLRIGTPR